jgi:hypothetical protein
LTLTNYAQKIGPTRGAVLIVDPLCSIWLYFSNFRSITVNPSDDAKIFILASCMLPLLSSSLPVEADATESFKWRIHQPRDLMSSVQKAHVSGINCYHEGSQPKGMTIPGVSPCAACYSSARTSVLRAQATYPSHEVNA